MRRRDTCRHTGSISGGHQGASYAVDAVGRTGTARRCCAMSWCPGRERSDHASTRPPPRLPSRAGRAHPEPTGGGRDVHRRRCHHNRRPGSAAWRACLSASSNSPPVRGAQQRQGQPIHCKAVRCSHTTPIPCHTSDVEHSPRSMATAHEGALPRTARSTRQRPSWSQRRRAAAPGCGRGRRTSAAALAWNRTRTTPRKTCSTRWLSMVTVPRPAPGEVRRHRGERPRRSVAARRARARRGGAPQGGPAAATRSPSRPWLIRPRAPTECAPGKRQTPPEWIVMEPIRGHRVTHNGLLTWPGSPAKRSKEREAPQRILARSQLGMPRCLRARSTEHTLEPPCWAPSLPLPWHRGAVLAHAHDQRGHQASEPDGRRRAHTAKRRCPPPSTPPAWSSASPR